MVSHVAAPAFRRPRMRVAIIVVTTASSFELLPTEVGDRMQTVALGKSALCPEIADAS